MVQLHALFVAAGADTHEGNTVAVFRVHVRLNLEHKTGEGRFGRLHVTLVAGARLRARCPVDDSVQHLINTEVTQCGTKEYRCHLALDEGVLIKLVAGALHQFQLFNEVVVQVAQVRASFVGVQAVDDLLLGALVAVARHIDDDLVFSQVIHALEVAVAANRPGDRRGLDVQDRFDLVEQLDWVADVAVEFVDEADDGRVAQTAHVHQRNGTRLNTLTAVQHHQRRVHRGQGAVGVFREVFVAGGVEQVDHGVAIGELHHRGGHRNAPLLFHRHPVGGGVAVGFARLDRTGHADRLAHQQQAFGDGGLTRIRVGDDGEGAPLGDFFFNGVGHVGY